MMVFMTRYGLSLFAPGASPYLHRKDTDTLSHQAAKNPSSFAGVPGIWMVDDRFSNITIVGISNHVCVSHLGLLYKYIDFRAFYCNSLELRWKILDKPNHDHGILNPVSSRAWPLRSPGHQILEHASALDPANLHDLVILVFSI